jgi:S-(hydroxymethyl)glutathione dehydrogenase/alcohol dehydrogenase
MKTKAAILLEQPGRWEIAEVDLDPPRPGELLIRMAAAGLCHSDDHGASGDIPLTALPMAGGHEGAGIVEEVGPDTPGWQPGDKVVLSFLPMCGLCKWCASGMQNLCDNGAGILRGVRPDGSRRMSLDGVPVSQSAGISTFSQLTTISAQSAVKIADDIPLDVACLTSCGVNTGWGSAVNSADVRPGHVVIVVGVGGIGMNAVQGAAHAGASVIIAVDPVPMKRDASLRFGATHAVETIDEAADLARGFTNGQGADACIVGATTRRRASPSRTWCSTRSGCRGRCSARQARPGTSRRCSTCTARASSSSTSSSPAATRLTRSTRGTRTCGRAATSVASSSTAEPA